MSKMFVFFYVINKSFYEVKNVIEYYQQNTITRAANELTPYAREVILRDAHFLHCARCWECNCTKIMHCSLLSRILSIVNSDWMQHARSARGVY